jgi:hypothetical protein
MGDQTKGVYKLDIYIRDYIYFILTREERKKVDDIGFFNIETSKHNVVDVTCDEITLVTEDQILVEKMIEYGLGHYLLKDYLSDYEEIMKDKEKEE